MKMILDTGATRHMTGNIKVFHTLNLQLDNNLINVVHLTDGNTTLPIHGLRNITINIGIHKITIKKFLYVLSIKRHPVLCNRAYKIQRLFFYGNK